MFLISDITLLEEVWRQLPSKSSTATEMIVLVSPEGNYGYDLANLTKHPDYKGREGIKILTRAEYEAQFKGKKDTLRWAPGVMGATIGDDHFNTLITRAMEKIMERIKESI